MTSNVVVIDPKDPEFVFKTIMQQVIDKNCPYIAHPLNIIKHGGTGCATDGFGTTRIYENGTLKTVLYKDGTNCYYNNGKLVYIDRNAFRYVVLNDDVYMTNCNTAFVTKVGSVQQPIKQYVMLNSNHTEFLFKAIMYQVVDRNWQYFKSVSAHYGEKQTTNIDGVTQNYENGILHQVVYPDSTTAGYKHGKLYAFSTGLFTYCILNDDICLTNSARSFVLKIASVTQVLRDQQQSFGPVEILEQPSCSASGDVIRTNITTKDVPIESSTNTTEKAATIDKPVIAIEQNKPLVNIDVLKQKDAMYSDVQMTQDEIDASVLQHLSAIYKAKLDKQNEYQRVLDGMLPIKKFLEEHNSGDVQKLVLCHTDFKSPMNFLAIDTLVSCFEKYPMLFVDYMAIAKKQNLAYTHEDFYNTLLKFALDTKDFHLLSRIFAIYTKK